MIMMTTGGRRQRRWLSRSPELRTSAVQPEQRSGGGGAGGKELVGFEPQCMWGSLGPAWVAQLGQMFSWDSFPSSAAHLMVSSASLFPRACGVSSFWCPQQCVTATSVGLQTVSSRVRISSLFSMSFPLAVRRPLSRYSAPCT